MISNGKTEFYPMKINIRKEFINEIFLYKFNQYTNLR